MSRASSPPARPRVLFIDDEPAVLSSLELTLSHRFEVLSATDGATALEILERDREIAVVVSDMRMPGMDGATVLAEARSRFPRTSRIALTGHTEIDVAARAVNAGRVSHFLLKPCSPEAVIRAVEDAMRERAQLVEAQKAQRQLEALGRLVESDELTSIANRRGLKAAFEGLLSRGSSPRQTLSLLLLDVDDFKRVNDIHGHAVGDAVLIALGDALLRAARRSDTVARYGGDEFVVILPGARADLAARIAERIRSTIANIELPAAEPAVRFKVSIGGVTVPPGSDVSLDAALARADVALYRAKRTGKNRVEWAETAPASR